MCGAKLDRVLYLACPSLHLLSNSNQEIFQILGTQRFGIAVTLCLSVIDSDTYIQRGHCPIGTHVPHHSPSLPAWFVDDYAHVLVITSRLMFGMQPFPGQVACCSCESLGPWLGVCGLGRMPFMHFCVRSLPCWSMQMKNGGAICSS